MNVSDPIKQFITKQVNQAVKIQEHYNAEFLKQLDLFIDQYQSNQDHLAAFQQALIPNRTLLETYEMTCRFQIDASKSKGFDLQINTIPLQYAVLFSEEESQSAQITIQVTQENINFNNK